MPNEPAGIGNVIDCNELRLVIGLGIACDADVHLVAGRVSILTMDPTVVAPSKERDGRVAPRWAFSPGVR